MRVLLAILLSLLCATASAQKGNSFGVAYYNVDKLYDTIPSRFYDDRAYTPAGRFGWDSNRYTHKIKQVAAVVDSIALPVVALYGVENEQVVKDIVTACRGDYAYIHRTSGGYDGLDFALLYFADCFYPDKVAERQGVLCVEGEVFDRPLTIVATHRSRSLGVMLDELKTTEDNNIIILGDVGKLNFNKWALVDATLGARRAGHGNRILRGVWHLQDCVLTNIDAQSHSDVYIRPWLLDRRGVPFATFQGGKYCGGYSSCLPIYIYFDNLFAF